LAQPRTAANLFLPRNYREFIAQCLSGDTKLRYSQGVSAPYFLLDNHVSCLETPGED
jgi:hypothetical protein